MMYTEENGRLLVFLKDKHGASGLGKICNFFATSPSWRCPCCFRNKEEIARVDKNLELLCSTHEHHDHLVEVADAIRFRRPSDSEAAGVISQSFERFSPLLICGDCNAAEGAAKQAARTPAAFSFAPHEIAGFIGVEPNLPHRVDGAKALLTYEALKPSLKLHGDRIRATREAVNTDGTGFEPVGAAAWRVIAVLRAKLDESGG